MPHRSRALCDKRQEQSSALEFVQVPFRNSHTALVPFVEMFETHTQQRSLKLIQPAIEASLFVVILALRPVVAKQPNPLGQLIVVGGYRAGIAVSPEILRRIKTPSGGVAKASHHAITVARTMSLGRVLDHLQTMPSRYLIDSVHFGGLPVQVH